MLLSMTGYGRIVREFDERTITVEIRSLNSKYGDVKIKLPQLYREKELDIRRIVTDTVKRGKVDALIEVQNRDGSQDFTLNRALFQQYFKELSEISQELNFEMNDVLSAIIRLPNVVSSNQGEISDEEWVQIQETLNAALEKLVDFRMQEGAILEEDFKNRIEKIQSLLAEIPPFEAERNEKMKAKLYQNLEDSNVKDAIDENRFEQEILYYLEKMDITEEKVRLEQHCRYFLKDLASKKDSKGKKLNFVCQEIGREINTIGSKANSSDIQRIVVQMKDELEKIKEQIANIL